MKNLKDSAERYVHGEEKEEEESGLGDRKEEEKSLSLSLSRRGFSPTAGREGPTNNAIEQGEEEEVGVEEEKRIGREGEKKEQLSNLLKRCGQSGKKDDLINTISSTFK